MQFISFLLVAFALPFLTSTTPINTTNTLWKREDELNLQLYEGTKPVGKATIVDNSVVGSVSTVTLPCGAVSVKILKETVTSCNFNLPATMPAGRFTGTPGNGFYAISMDGACAGTVNAASTFVNVDAGAIGEVTGPPCSNGKADAGNLMTLCVSGTSLVDC